MGTLKLSGYVRGQALNVNSLVHLPGRGDFQMKQIDAPADPYPLQTKERKNKVRELIIEIYEGHELRHAFVICHRQSKSISGLQAIQTLLVIVLRVSVQYIIRTGETTKSHESFRLEHRQTQRFYLHLATLPINFFL